MVAYEEELEQEVPKHYNEGLRARHTALRFLNRGWRRTLFEDFGRAQETLSNAGTWTELALGSYHSAQSAAEENDWSEITDAVSQAKAEIETYQKAVDLLLESVELRQDSEDETEISQGVEKQEKATAIIDEGDSMNIVGIEQIRAWVDERTE